MKTYCLHDPPYTKNPDVGALQHALKNNGMYTGPIDDILGPSTGSALKKARWRLGYPSRAIIPCGGQTLLDYLHGTKGLPPAYVIRRHTRGFGLTKQQKIRKSIVDLAMWGVYHESKIHYRQYRPMDELRNKQHLPWYTDCSEFITTIYKWGGGPDPNGSNFNGYGNTDSMAGNGHTIPLWDAEPADVVIWGRFNSWGWWTHHTAIIVNVANRSNPQIVSHGSERGPLHISLADETSAQRSFGAGQYIIKKYIGV